MRFIRHILTGRDNSTYDIVRVGMLLGLIMICGETVWGLSASPVIDLEKLGELLKSFSISIATVLGWGSIGCAAKFHTEPEAE